MKRATLLSILLTGLMGCTVQVDPPPDLPPEPPSGTDPAQAAALETVVAEASSVDVGSALPLPDNRIVIEGRESVRADVLPLFVLGDVDEDGVVGPPDVELIEAYVAELDGGLVSCPAAADLTMDGTVDERDAAQLADMVRGADLAAPPLYANPTMDCSYRNIFVAGSAGLEPGEPVRLRLLGEGVDPTDVEIEVDAEAEIVPADDGPGWDVYLFDPAITQVTITIWASGAKYLYTVVKHQEEITETRIDAGDDPRDTPPPVVHGEELDNGECPQEGAGCEALIIDFQKYNDRTFPTAEKTAEALRNIDCNVTYLAPRFTRLPDPTVFERTMGAKEAKAATTEAINAAKAENLRAWADLRAGIMAYRTRIAAGRELVYQLVNAHGGNVGTCGHWGSGFETGAGLLGRATFHGDNYRWANGNVCTAVAEDRSCYAGQTARAIESLNNRGAAVCSRGAPTTSHRHHAAYYGDIALANSTPGAVSYPDDFAAYEDNISAMIRDRGRLGVASGFRQEALHPTLPPSNSVTARYSDLGYNTRPDAFCDDGRHQSGW